MCADAPNRSEKTLPSARVPRNAPKKPSRVLGCLAARQKNPPECSGAPQRAALRHRFIAFWVGFSAQIHPATPPAINLAPRRQAAKPVAKNPRRRSIPSRLPAFLIKNHTPSGRHSPPATPLLRRRRRVGFAADYLRFSDEPVAADDADFDDVLRVVSHPLGQLRVVAVPAISVTALDEIGAL